MRMQMIRKRKRLMEISGGQRVALVPTDVPNNPRLSAGAKNLFTVLCGNADRDGRCWRSVGVLAKSLGVTRRSIQKWLVELEWEGRLLRRYTRGQINEFTVIRDPAEVEGARWQSRGTVARKRAVFGS